MAMKFNIEPKLDKATIKEITGDLKKLLDSISDPSRIGESDIDDFLSGLNDLNDLVHKSELKRHSSMIRSAAKRITEE